MSALPQGAVPADSATEESTPTGPVTESFGAIVLRRTRYAVAIAICAYIFYSLGWALVAPTQPPCFATASLWLGAPAAGLMASVGMLVLLLGCIVLSMALTHPDVPHIGLYCAGLGLAALSIRGGSIRLVASQAQVQGQTATFFTHLAVEAGLWLLIVLMAEAVSLWLFSRVFKNLVWLQRHGSSPETPEILQKHDPVNPLVDITLGKADTPRDWTACLGALAATVLIGGALLTIMLRTELKGQVLFACFVSFGIAAFAAQQIFPRTATWAIWAGVPLTALIGFAMAGHSAFPYPGHVGLALSRGLPMDYVAAGIPGAVLGYYTGLRWQIHQIIHEQ